MKTYTIPSTTKPGVTYTVTHNGYGWECDCTAGTMNMECVHIRKVKNAGQGRRVNEHLIVISRSAMPIGREFKMDEDVSLIVEGSVVKIEEKSRQDGTFDRVVVIKPIIVSINADTSEETLS